MRRGALMEAVEGELAHMGDVVDCAKKGCMDGPSVYWSGYRSGTICILHY